MSLRNIEVDYQSLKDIPSSFFSALGMRMVSVLSGATAGPIEALEKKLSSVMRRVLTQAESALVDGIQDISRENLTAQAFTLGQLSFAQQLTASAGLSRTDDAFHQAISEERWQAYFRELMKGEQTNGAIAERVGEATETVSRKLKSLRGMGITEFRKEGTFVYNFLTPVALQILEARKQQGELSIGSEYDCSHDDVMALLAVARAKQPNHMRHALTFGPSHAD